MQSLSASHPYFAYNYDTHDGKHLEYLVLINAVCIYRNMSKESYSVPILPLAKRRRKILGIAR